MTGCKLFVVHRRSRWILKKVVWPSVGRISEDLFGRILLRSVFFRKFLLHSANFRNLFAETFTKRKYLEAARIGHGRAAPAHKLGDATGPLDQIFTGREVEVVGIGDNGLQTKLFKIST